MFSERWLGLVYNLVSDIVVYSVLINSFAEIGDVHGASRYVKLLKSSGYSLNSIICNSLIKLYTKVGYLGEAQETYEMTKSMENAPDVYSSNCMIDLYCENAMVKEAEEIFVNLRRKGEATEFSYAIMFCLYKKIGRIAEAYGVAREMVASGLLKGTLSYNNVIGLYASDGRLKEAVKIFQEMLASGAQPNDATYRSLGVALLKRGASKESINQLESIRKKDAQSGMQEWFKARCSMLRLDDVGMNYGNKTSSQFEVDISSLNMLSSSPRSIDGSMI